MCFRVREWTQKVALVIFCSVHFAYSHVISRLSDTSLNVLFYNILKTDAYDYSAWNDITIFKTV